VANIKSQMKRNRQSEVRRVRNKAVRSELRTRTKVALRSLGSEESEAVVRLILKRIDKAAAKGVIHKNAAARRKSRLMKRVNAAKSEA